MWFPNNLFKLVFAGSILAAEFFYFHEHPGLVTWVGQIWHIFDFMCRL